MKKLLALSFISMLLVTYIWAQESTNQQTGSVRLSNQEDHARLMKLLGVKVKRPGRNGTDPQHERYANYDESKANPYADTYPDVLVMKNGQKVTTPEQWWQQRRPEIVEDFAREVYGRVPDNVPKVTWEVTETTEGQTGDIPTKTKRVIGHVDNSSYPAITVDIQLSVTTPADAAGPVPVIIAFGGGFGGGDFRRGGGLSRVGKQQTDRQSHRPHGGERTADPKITTTDRGRESGVG